MMKVYFTILFCIFFMTQAAAQKKAMNYSKIHIDVVLTYNTYFHDRGTNIFIIKVHNDGKVVIMKKSDIHLSPEDYSESLIIPEVIFKDSVVLRKNEIKEFKKLVINTDVFSFSNIYELDSEEQELPLSEADETMSLYFKIRDKEKKIYFGEWVSPPEELDVIIQKMEEFRRFCYQKDNK